MNGRVVFAKNRLIQTIGWVAVIWLLSELCIEEFERITLNQVTAQKYAEKYMQTACEKMAPSLGIQCQSYFKFEAMDTTTRSFEFRWHYPNGLLFAVGVADNGLFMEFSNSWWKESRNSDGTVSVTPVETESM